MPQKPQDDDVVMGLVESALTRPAGEREAYLESACAGDPDLYQQVWDYIQWELRMNGFLLQPFCVPAAVEHPFVPGQLLEQRFRIEREVARGGMGVVYEATDEKLARRVALKCAMAGFGQRLPPEVRHATAISHPNVCKTFEIHTADTRLGKIDFLTMEFLDGETLAERLARGPVQKAEAATIARQLCSGLAEAHHNKVIHGDLKSNNVILSTDADGAIRAVITDFGLARAPESALRTAQSGVRGGTPDYMAPELVRGERASVATDIYALGVLMHVLLTGHTPRRVSGESEAERCEVESLSSPWQRVIVQCLEPRPEDRFATVEAVWAAIEKRRPVTKWLIAALVTVIMALAIGLWQSREKPGTPIRLAVLPFVVDGNPLATADGIAYDVANRLSGLRKNLAVISPREAARNQVRTVQDAKSLLNPTHVLETRLENSGQVIVASAELIDVSSGRVVRELKGDYAPGDTQILTKALIATVTRALDLRSSISKEPISAAAYSPYVQGIALLQRDTHSADQAILFLRKASEIDPRSALPLAGIAEAELQKFSTNYGGSWLERAERTVAKAKSLNPDSVAVLLASGLLNQEKGFYEHAVQDFARATEIDANNPDPWRRLATVYDRMNQPDEAIAAFHKAMALQPGYYRAFSDFGIFYYQRGRYREAEDLMRKVVELAPNLDAGHGNLGVFLMDDGRYEDAEKELLQALRLRESEANLNNLGALYNYEERDREAIQFYERGLAIGPPTIAQYLNLGDTYRRLGRAHESLAAYKRGKALAEAELIDNPRQSISRADLALFCARLGDRGRAEFEIAQALQMAPEDGKVMRVAALTYEVLNQRSNTLKSLLNAPADILGELSRQPDLRQLQQDSGFIDIVSKKLMQQKGLIKKEMR